MKVRINPYTPERCKKGWTFSFAILPEFEVFWKDGLNTIWIGWLFWDVAIFFKD